MAVFGEENWREEWPIQELFAPVVLFDELQVLVDALGYLRERGYVVHEIDCGVLQTPHAILNDVLRHMGILSPDFTYRDIMDIQFWDLLRNAEMPQESGLVLAFKHFSSFHREHPERAQQTLNSITGEHFYNLMRGRRFWACAHCEDRELKLEPLQTIEAQWNRRQWDAHSLARSKKVEPFTKALREAREVLAARLPHGMPREAARRLPEVLCELTGARDSGALIDMGLSARDMVRLLQDHDFNA